MSATRKQEQAAAPQESKTVSAAETKQPSSATLAKAIIRKDIGCGELKEHEELVTKIYEVETALARYYQNRPTISRQAAMQVGDILKLHTSAETLAKKLGFNVIRLKALHLLATFEFLSHTQKLSNLRPLLENLRQQGIEETNLSAITLTYFVQGLMFLQVGQQTDARASFISGILSFNHEHHQETEMEKLLKQIGIATDIIKSTLKNPTKSAHSDLLQCTALASNTPGCSFLENQVLMLFLQLEKTTGTSGIASEKVQQVNDVITAADAHFPTMIAPLFFLRGLFKFQHHQAFLVAKRTAPRETEQEDIAYQEACRAITYDVEIACWVLEKQRSYFEKSSPADAQSAINSLEAFREFLSGIYAWLRQPELFTIVSKQDMPTIVNSLIIGQIALLRSYGKNYPFMNASQPRPVASANASEQKDQKASHTSTLTELVNQIDALWEIAPNEHEKIKQQAISLFAEMKTRQAKLHGKQIQTFVEGLESMINSMTRGRHLPFNPVNEICDVAITLCKTHAASTPALFRALFFFHLTKYTCSRWPEGKHISPVEIRANLIDSIRLYNQKREKKQINTPFSDLGSVVTLLLRLDRARLDEKESSLRHSVPVIEVTEAIYTDAIGHLDLSAHLFFARALFAFQQHQSDLLTLVKGSEKNKAALIKEIRNLIADDLEIACWIMSKQYDLAKEKDPTSTLYWSDCLTRCRYYLKNLDLWLSSPEKFELNSKASMSTLTGELLEIELAGIRQYKKSYSFLNTVSSETLRPESELMLLAKKIMEQGAQQKAADEKDSAETIKKLKAEQAQKAAAEKARIEAENRAAEEKRIAEAKQAEEAAAKKAAEEAAKKAAEKAQKEQDRKRRKEENRLRSQQEAQKAARQAEAYRLEAEQKAQQKAQKEKELKLYAGITKKQEQAASQSLRANAELKELTTARLIREAKQQAAEQKAREAKSRLETLAMQRKEAAVKLAMIEAMRHKAEETLLEGQLIVDSVKAIATAREEAKAVAEKTKAAAEEAKAAAEAKIRLITAKSATYRVPDLKLEIHPKLAEIEKLLSDMGLFVTIGGGYLRDLLMKHFKLIKTDRLPYKLHSNGQDKIFDFDLNILSSVTESQAEMIMRAFRSERIKTDKLDAFCFTIENPADNEVYKFQIRISPCNEQTRTDPMFADAAGRDTAANTPCLHNGEVYFPLPQTEAFFTGKLKETQVLRVRIPEQKEIPGITKSQQDLMNDPVRIPRLMIRSILDEYPPDRELKQAMSACAALVHPNELQKIYGKNGENIDYVINKFNGYWFELLCNSACDSFFMNTIIVPHAFPDAAMQMKHFEFTSESKADISTLAGLYERLVSYECFTELSDLKAQEEKEIAALEHSFKDEQSLLINAQLDTETALKNAHRDKVYASFKPKMDAARAELAALKQQLQDVANLYDQKEKAEQDSKAHTDEVERSRAILAIRKEKREKLLALDQPFSEKREVILKRINALAAEQDREIKASSPKTELNEDVMRYSRQLEEISFVKNHQVAMVKQQYADRVAERITQAIEKNSFYRCCFGKKIKTHIENIANGFGDLTRKPKAPSPKPVQSNQQVLQQQQMQMQQMPVYSNGGQHQPAFFASPSSRQAVAPYHPGMTRGRGRGRGSH